MDHDSQAPVVRRTKRTALTRRAVRRPRKITDCDAAGQEPPTVTGSWWLVLPTVAIGLAASG